MRIFYLNNPWYDSCKEEKGNFWMLKIVVYDSGYGGEIFADQLEKELPTVEVIRVIDWRNAEQLLMDPRKGKKLAALSLRPYIGRVDLIVFTNYLLSATSQNYFSKKFRNQKFAFIRPNWDKSQKRKKCLILTTKAFAKTTEHLANKIYLWKKSKTLALDSWPSKIDDGELRLDEIKENLTLLTLQSNWYPEEVIITCSQFSDIRRELKSVLGYKTKILDGNDALIRDICKSLHIRGALRKRK